MRFAVLVKANEQSEAGVMPTAEQLDEMGKFNEELIRDGVMLAADGLLASSKGVRIRFSGGKTTVVDGPFAETKELVSGFWIVQAKSRDEVVERMKRAPFGHDAEIEIRQIMEADDFGADMTDKVRAQEERLHAIQH